MTLNINTVYKQHWKDFWLLGKSMKNYTIASWISMGVRGLSLLLYLIAFIPLMIVPVNSNSIDSLTSKMMGLFGISLILNVIGLGITIYLIYAYIQYLIQLKKVGDYTNDKDLQNSYKLELWAFLTPIILFFIIVVFLFISVGLMAEIDVNSFMMFYFGFLFIIFIIALIPIILQILSVFALDRWGQRIKMANPQNPYAKRFSDGINSMKIGKIISIFFGIIGTIIFLVGFMKAGENIMKFFDGIRNLQSTNVATIPQFSKSNTSQQSSAFTTNSNISSGYTGNTLYGSTTMKPHDLEFCPFCGSKSDDKKSKFCANCGRKLL